MIINFIDKNDEERNTKIFIADDVKPILGKYDILDSVVFFDGALIDNKDEHIMAFYKNNKVNCAISIKSKEVKNFILQKETVSNLISTFIEYKDIIFHITYEKQTDINNNEYIDITL